MSHGMGVVVVVIERSVRECVGGAKKTVRKPVGIPCGEKFFVRSERQAGSRLSCTYYMHSACVLIVRSCKPTADIVPSV